MFKFSSILQYELSVFSFILTESSTFQLIRVSINFNVTNTFSVITSGL